MNAFPYVYACWRWRTALDTERSCMNGKPKGMSQNDFWVEVALGKAKAIIQGQTWDEGRSAASNFAIRTAVTGNLRDLQEWNYVTL